MAYYTVERASLAGQRAEKLESLTHLMQREREIHTVTLLPHPSSAVLNVRNWKQFSPNCLLGRLGERAS